MAKKAKWEDENFSAATVLNHSRCLRLKKFTNDDLDDLAACDDIWELELESSVAGEVVDLVKLSHIKALTSLTLNKVKFKNLHLLQPMPNLRCLVIDGVAFSNFAALDGWERLETLFMWHCKLTVFPTGLKLPKLEHLLLSDNAITDLSFAASYPTLRRLDLSHNPITDLSTLAACDWLEHLVLTDTLIQSLDPISGFKHLTRLSLSAQMTPEGNTLLQPEAPADPNDPCNMLHEEIRRVAALVRQKQWAQLYAISNLEVLGHAFRWVFHDALDNEILRGMLAHPAPGAWEAAVIAGLDAHYSSVVKLTFEGFKELGDRIIEPLMAGFHHYLATPGLYDGFHVGKFKLAHVAIADLITAQASPAYTELFMAFFSERERFSAVHLRLYKKLLDGVGKTKSQALVEPIIDLLRFEKQVIGGDAVLLKKALKGIGQLGKRYHIPLLEAAFDLDREERVDVREAYSAALLRLQKSTA